VGNATFSITDIVDNFFSMSTAFFEAVVVTLFAGFYLAAQPSLYRDGLISLAPLGAREKVRTTLDVMAQALRLWLVGQFIQMALIGLLSALAALAIGLPSPLALGLIAGVAEFIPYLGPIIAAVPALLVAATVSVHTVLWTLFVYFLIHQVEADLIVPLMQRRMVYIPPVVMLMSVAALTYLFGWSVIIFAAPIVVILFVGVNKLYVRDCLGETVQLPGELEPSEPKTRIIGSDAASLKLG
jgi:predicted PurR-regulated permease PerM